MPDEENPASSTADASTSSTTAIDSADTQQQSSKISALGGYNEIADFMKDYPQYAITRRFGYLNYLNILYLQAEIVDLEVRLLDYSKKDAHSTDRMRRKYQHSWYSFSRHETESGAADQN